MSKLIQSVYDCIQLKKFKKALTILESPELDRYPSAKALEGYCAVQLGSRERARKAVEEQIKLKPTDEHILKQTMVAIHYLGDYSLAVRLLEPVHAIDKNNISTAEMLYLAYFCQREFDKMRDLSNEMIKLYKVQSYRIWNCANVLLNREPENPATYKNVMLLSERIVQKSLKEMDLNSREGRNYQWLYIQILIREGKFEEAAKELEERLQNYLVAKRLLDDRMLQRSVLKEVGREQDVIDLLEGDIRSGEKDGWDAIDYYISTCFELLPQEEALSKIESFSKELCQDPNTREKWHFRLEVATRQVKAGKAEKIALTTLICDYINYIGHKACCFQDLERWLPEIKGDEPSMHHLTQFLISILNVTFFVEKSPKLLSNVQKKVTAIEVCQEVGIPVNDECYIELYRLYKKMMPEYAETLNTKEVLSLDAIPLLIARSLHCRAIAEKENEMKKMLLECEAMTLLRKNMEERPHFFRSTLALTLLYYQMGMPTQALASYEKLEVKEVHLMSLSYPLEAIASEWSMAKEFKQHIQNINTFLNNGIKEAHEKEFACIRKETFVNMQTIHDLAVRLRNSREMPAFLAQYFMSVLPASLKEPDMINQPMFDDLLLPLSTTLVNNADYAYARYWPIVSTQLNAIATHPTMANALLAFQHAVCAYLLQAQRNGWCGTKVSSTWSQAVSTTFAALRETTGLPAIVLNGYEVFVACVEALAVEGEVPVDALLARGRACIENIRVEFASLMGEKVVFGEGLSQIQQLVKHVMTWMVLLLEKNKKCKKPAVAKEPKMLVLSELLGDLLRLSLQMLNVPTKEQYWSELEKANLTSGMVIADVKSMVMLVNSSHFEQISSLKSFCEDLVTRMKAKFFKFVVEAN